MKIEPQNEHRWLQRLWVSGPTKARLVLNAEGAHLR
jgi:hypothetical protein